MNATLYRLLVLCSTLTAVEAATVTNYVTDGTGRPVVAGNVIIRPLDNPRVINGVWVTPATVSAKIASGCWSKSLVTGWYQFDDNTGRPLVGYVPDDTNTYTLAYVTDTSALIVNTNQVTTFVSNQVAVTSSNYNYTFSNHVYNTGPYINASASRTPPLAFDTWSWSAGNALNEGVVSNIVWVWKNDTKVLNYGWKWIVLDDAIFTNRAANLDFLIDTNRFPNGWPWLYNYVKTNGFKIGRYFRIGTIGIPGLGQPPTSVSTAWHDATNIMSPYPVDLIRLDGNSGDTTNSLDIQRAIVDCLQIYCLTTGVSMPYIESHPPTSPGYQQPWLIQNANAFNIQVSVNGVESDNSWTIYTNWIAALDTNLMMMPYVRPGFHPVMQPIYALNTAMTGWLTNVQRDFQVAALTSGEVYIHTMWEGISTNLTWVFTNSELLAVHQDPIVAPTESYIYDTLQILKKPLVDGSYAIGFLWRDLDTNNTTAVTYTVTLPMMHLPPATYSVRDLFSRTNLASVSGNFSVTVAQQCIRTFKFSPQPSAFVKVGIVTDTGLPTGAVGLTASDLAASTFALQGDANVTRVSTPNATGVIEFMGGGISGTFKGHLGANGGLSIGPTYEAAIPAGSIEAQNGFRVSSALIGVVTNIAYSNGAMTNYMHFDGGILCYITNAP